MIELHASKSGLKKSMDTPEISVSEDIWGEMHVEYDVFKKKFDVTPLLKGLPNDRDPTPHWGLVTKGQVRVIYDGKEEVIKAGDAYYIPPNHTAVAEAGTEAWEFSPKDVLEKAMKVMARNMEAVAKKK